MRYFFLIMLFSVNAHSMTCVEAKLIISNIDKENKTTSEVALIKKALSIIAFCR